MREIGGRVKPIEEKKLSAAEIRFLVFGFLIVAAVLVALVGANLVAAQRLEGGGGVIMPWKNVRVAFGFDNGEPYSGAVATYVQRQVYGASVRAGENPYYFDLPFYLALLYAPLSFFANPGVMRGLYLLLSEAGLVLLAFFGLRLTDWQPRRLFTALYYLFASLGLYGLLALLEGAPAILLGLVYVSILLALRVGMDELAGALLAVVFAHWEVGGPFVLLVLLYVLAQRRTRFWTGFIIPTFSLAAIAYLIQPGWVFPYVVGVFANWTSDFGLTPGAIFVRLWPEIGSRLGWGLTALSVLILAFEWARARSGDFRRFYWAACLTLSLTPLMGMRSGLENLAVLVPAAALIFATVRERWKAGYWLAWSLLAVFFAAPWILYLGGFLPADLRVGLAFLFLPVVTVIGLYWVRRWAIRPPRTWTERATNPERR